MSNDAPLVRLNPFEGLCLTAADLITEQRYHRASLRRHARFLSGHGVVQGLSVELQQKLDRYEVTVKEGYGLTETGQGLQLAADLTLTLEPQEVDGEYMLWLVHVEQEDPDSLQPVFDTSDRKPARILERLEARLLPAEEARPDGVALARIRVRLGRMAHIRIPVPRAGRVLRAAESYLKPRVLEYVELNRKAMQLLFRTAVLQELSISAYGFYAGLVSAELLLIEEGTADRVLYRTAGTLVRHGRSFYDSDAVRELTDRVSQVSQLLRTLDDAMPQADHEDRQWQSWFEQFERLLPPLQRMTEELQATVEATKEAP